MYSTIQRLIINRSDRILVIHAPEAFLQVKRYIAAGMDRKTRSGFFLCRCHLTDDLDIAESEITTVLPALAHDTQFWFCYSRTSNKTTRAQAVQNLFVYHRHINNDSTAARLRLKEGVQHIT